MLFGGCCLDLAAKISRNCPGQFLHEGRYAARRLKENIPYELAPSPLYRYTFSIALRAFCLASILIALIAISISH